MGRDRAPRQPNLSLESTFWASGCRFVAGVDEVGRGAMAGPLVAAAIILPGSNHERHTAALNALAGVRDSKELLPDQRERLLPLIVEWSLAVSVGSVDAGEIDAVGVGPANRIAMERAVLGLPFQPDALLLDATTVDLAMPQVGMIDGDAISLTIAAASIVAKVTRDRWMAARHIDDPRYRFDIHKGYCTPDHLEKLRAHGPCDFHRRCFAPVAEALALTR